MNTARLPVRNILLTVVVACAFIVDARTSRASVMGRPGNAAPAEPQPSIKAWVDDSHPMQLRAGRPAPGPAGCSTPPGASPRTHRRAA